MCRIHNFLFPFYNIYEKFPWLKRAHPESVWTTLGGKVRPQASDDAELDTYSLLWGVCAYAIGFSLFAIIKDLQLRWPTIEEMRLEQRRGTSQVRDKTPIVPHADEHEKSELTEEQENVTFSDANSGHVVDYTGSDDPLRSQPLNIDATLDHFFSRPIKIHEQEWGVGSAFGFTIDPWTLYFTNQRVINRIANYKLMKADLHVKVMLNGNAFHYGRCIVSYNPLRLQDQYTIDRTFIDADVVAASQRPHIWLNPTTSEGGEMKLPFFFHKNLIDIVGQDWREMGELSAHSLQPLKHANGATDDVTVSVFAWTENVQFSIPTQVEPGAIAPQAMEIEPHADEYTNTPVSRIAGAVAKYAGYLTEIPAIGTFARATEIGAKAVGAVATLFGYSSPVMLEACHYRPLPKTNLANTNVHNDSNKLTLDGKQELSCDPRTVGLEPEDQMTITYVAGRESWLTSYNWNIGTAPETLLWQAVVDPGLHVEVGPERHFPAPCFAVMPFKYWRGSMRFRFMVVSSAYHKGRLKIVYDPEGGIGNAEYNTAYTTIVDISQETDFTVDVGWGQSTTWREHKNIVGPVGYGPGVQSYTSSSVGYGNGTISVYVVNELTVPNSSVNNDVEVNVLVSMLDDFEVCVPTERYIRQLRTTTAAVTTAPQAEIEPQAMEELHKIEPTKDSSITHMANKVPINDPSSLFHFGEAVGSFRQILKRYILYEYLRPLAADPGTYITSYDRPHFPLTPGYSTNPATIGPPSYTLSGGDYTFVFMTPMKYISLGYAAHRGGVRYAVDTTPLLNDGARCTGMVSRDYAFNYASNETNSIPTNTGTPLGAFLNDNPYTFDATAMFTSQVNPVLSFETPHFTRFRFAPAKRRDTDQNSSPDPFTDSWRLSIQGRVNDDNNQWLPMWTAAAEDYTCFWYLGPPIFYVQTLFPTT